MVGGALVVTSSGTISQVGTLTVGGTSQFTALGQAITLDSANDFVGAVRVTAAQLSLRDVNAISLGDVTLSASLSLTAGGAVSESGVLTVGGTSQFTALGQSVTLDGANDFVGAVRVTAAQLSLRDVNAMDLGDVTLSAALALTAGGSVSGSGVLNIAGASQFTALGQSVTLDSANDFVGAVRVTAAQLSLRDANAIDLGAVTLSDSLALTASGAVSESGVLNIAGTSRFTALGQSVTLDRANDFVGAVHVSGAALSLNDVNAIDLGDVTLSGSLALTAGGSVSGSGVLNIAGASQFTALGQSVTLDSANDFVGAVRVTAAQLSLRDANAIDLGAVTLSDSLALTASGAVSESGVLNIAGTSRFTALGQSVTLDRANDFVGAVHVSGAALSLRDVNAIDLGDVTLTGSLSLTAGGSVSESGVLNIAGASQFTALGQAITLDSANDFVGAVHVNAAQLSLRDVNAIDLGDVTLSASLSLTAGGAVSESGVLNIAGTSQFTALGQAITLDSANDFVGAVRVSGAALSLRDVNAIDLGAVTLSDSLALTASGAVSESGVLNIAGASQFTALGQTITLDSANDFGGAVRVSGAAVSLKDSKDLTVALDTTGKTELVATGEVTLSGVVTHDLSVSSQAGLRQNAALTVNGTLTLHAAKTLDLSQANRFAGLVVAQAQDIILAAVSALDLGEVTAEKSLRVVSTGGAITLHARPTATTQLSLHAATGIVFNSDMVLSAQSVDLSAAQDLGSSAAPLRLATNQVVARSTEGDVFIQLMLDGPTHVQVVAHGQVSVVRDGALNLASGSSLESKTGSITVRASQDLLISGTTLLAARAALEAGRSIKGVALEYADPVSISGALHLEAETGIGGFGFVRILVHALNKNASVSAYNGQSGDVVIAGQNGLTVAAEGIKSDANGWVGLLGGTGTITENGQVVAKSSNVVRVTGVDWISLHSAETTMLWSSSLNSGALLMESSSPLEQMNRRLAQSWSRNVPAQSVDEALTSSAPLLSMHSRTVIGVPTHVVSEAGTRTVMGSQPTISNLIERAMAPQGNNPTMGDTESLNAWFNHASPSNTAETGLAHTDGVPQSEPIAKPVLENPVNERAPAPVLIDPATQPESAPETPSEVPTETPTSNVRWLLPQDDLAILFSLVEAA